MNAYDQIKSRSPEQRRRERDAREVARQQANQKGADGIRVVRGGTVQAGPELTDPPPFGVNGGTSGSGETHVFIFINNGIAEYWSIGPDGARYIRAVT